MITVELCVDGKGDTHSIELEGAREFLKDENALVWVNMGRSREELQKLGDKLGFHRLAIEDATEDRERPKTTIFEDHVFILLYALTSADDRVHTIPVSLFIGKNYLVTVTDEPAPALQQVAERWREFHGSIKDKSPGTLAYSLIDAMVDEYFPILDRIGDRLENLETGLIEHKYDRPQQVIHDMRMELLQLRRVIGPEREAINTLLRRDVPIFDDTVTTYFGDVYDHLLRSLDWIDTYRDVLSNLSDLQISVASHRLNQTMRTMTAWSIIFMATTLIAGIYGMNFDHMPELHWRLGYPASLLAMAGVGGGIFYYLKRRDWI